MTAIPDIDQIGMEGEHRAQYRNIQERMESFARVSVMIVSMQV